MWDETNLYVAARVFDPEHSQTETGPSVWKGDTLWVYLDTNRDRSSVDAKLTLAQTPSGPQIWDWKASAFVRDAAAGLEAGHRLLHLRGKAALEALWVCRKWRPASRWASNWDAAAAAAASRTCRAKDPDTAANMVPADAG